MILILNSHWQALKIDYNNYNNYNNIYAYSYNAIIQRYNTIII